MKLASESAELRRLPKSLILLIRFGFPPSAEEEVVEAALPLPLSAAAAVLLLFESAALTALTMDDVDGLGVCLAEEVGWEFDFPES